MAKKILYLLDGMALAYRAHFAFINANLINSEGIATGPIMGFANTLDKMLDEKQPTHIAVAWDTHAPTFRHEKDESYKANRPPQPEELRQGIPLIKEMLEAWGIPSLEQDGYEADDIIGTIASDANEADVDVWMVTPDKDFMQLVHDHIRMLKPNNKDGGFDEIDREGVKDYFGVYPENVIDVLAILGDTSDNIPGVPGIGKKGAPKLIETYGSLEKVIEQAPAITAKRQREGLIEFADQAMHAKFMVTIKTDVPETSHWSELEWSGPDKARLAEFFRKMEFRTLSRKYGDSNAPAEDASPAAKSQGDLFGPAIETPASDLRKMDASACNYTMITDEDSLTELTAKLETAEAICFDTETDSADPLHAALVGISIAIEAAEAWYIPVDREGVLTTEQVVRTLAPVFSSDSKVKVAHNYKFDYQILRRHGLRVKGPVFDTMIAAYLTDTSQKTKMDELAKHYLNYQPVPIEQLIGGGKAQISMADLEPEQVYMYACEDADITLQLFAVLRDKLKEDDLLVVAETVDFPLIEVLAEMEMKGIRIDTQMLAQFSGELKTSMLELEAEIYEKAGEEFNINSPSQLGVILFDKLGLPAGKKTKTGKYSTNEAVLTKLAVKYEIPDLILGYRSLSKLRSTYVEALPTMADPDSGRVHTDYNQSVAATGRLASSNPNLQNIPIRTAKGREIRKAFITDDGFTMMSADYSQVELRVIAHIADDENMKQAFRNGEDIHARTAKEIFHLDSLDEVTPDHRRKAKEVNFGIPYGLSAFGLAQNLGIENGEAKEMIDEYFSRFPGIGGYIAEVKEFAREHGYVQTLLGRRRYIPDINSGNWNQRGFAERVAINMPIQGTAADIIKLAMIRIHNWMESESLKSRMLLQVHDELIFEIHNDEMERVPRRILEMMEQAYPLDVPLKVESGTGSNWLESH